jgi:hypothetical protein
MRERKALTREVSARYRKAGKKDKTVILNEFVKNTGYNRKYALRQLNGCGRTVSAVMDGKPVKFTAVKRRRPANHTGKCRYDEEFMKRLRKLWAFFGYRCGKYLAPLLREQMTFIAGWHAFDITDAIRQKLVAISPAQIDRKLKKDKDALRVKGVSGTRLGDGSLIKSIPIRTCYTQEEKRPGFFQIDTVHHCGDHDSGDFNLTLTCTDAFSGWIELRPLLNKAQVWCLSAMKDVYASLLFPLIEIHSDNGSEFINHDFNGWRLQQLLGFTHSRSYHKNDNCFAEQQNNQAVRKTVGYYRFDTPKERNALASVYQALCPLLNYFIPTRRLLSKTKTGSKYVKKYDQPLSPYQRLLASQDIPDEVKARLTGQYRLYNPVVLQDTVHKAVNSLLAAHSMKALK